MLLGVLSLLGCAQKPKLAERVEKALLRALPDAQVKIEDPATLKVKLKEHGGEFTVSLDNLRLECAKGEGACRDAIDSLVANVKLVSGPQDEMRLADVRLTLKDQGWLDEAERRMADVPPEKRAQNELLREPFVGDVSIVYVLDLPRGIRMLQAGDLPKLGVDRTKLAAVARENLKREFVDVTLVRVEGTDLWTLARTDAYASASLVLVDLWKPYADKLGTLVVSAPARNRVFATGPEKPEQIAALRAATRHAFGVEPHALSGLLLKWTPAGWKVLSAPN
jgi:uncharacterized protein YtpQ (UPF0354 family)